VQRGVTEMNEEKFNKFAELLEKYLETQKVFVQNPQRMEEVNAATETACRLFPDAKISIEDDPLQMGAAILRIEDFDIVVRETEDFCSIIDKANNFDIYPVGDEKIRIDILFADALIRI
jgi:hypothetical protein